MMFLPDLWPRGLSPRNRLTGRGSLVPAAAADQGERPATKRTEYCQGAYAPGPPQSSGMTQVPTGEWIADCRLSR